MKAYQQINSDCAVSFRDNLRKGRIKLLINENVCKEILNGLKGYDKLPPDIQSRFINPFIQTTAVISEMINLEADINQDTGMVKLKEPRTGRKDRWSSISYGNYFANLLERDLLRDEDDCNEQLVFF
jgi:hypothetical protein